MHGKRIAFVLYDYNLSTSTALINTIEMLQECGNDILIYTNIVDEKDHHSEPKIRDSIHSIDVNLYLNNGPFLLKYLRKGVRWSNKIISKIMRTLLHRKESWTSKNWAILNFASALATKIQENAFDIVIAIECFGLIAVNEALKGKIIKAETFYFDLELLDWSPENPLYNDKLELKQRQFDALSKVKRVYITSFNRARIFSEINKFPEDRISVLPVVPRRREITGGSNYFRKKFQIDEHKLLVIYSGNFMPWARCLEIIESVKCWPENTVLVMHTWNKSALESDYYSQMRSAVGESPVYFSSNYLSYEEMADALSSADLGLLYYEEIDENFTEIFLSSNKMGEYIASGLPIICSPFPSLKKFVDEEGIGMAVNIDEIGDAINKISKDLDGYRRRVEKSCEEHFVFEKYFDDVVHTINDA